MTVGMSLGERHGDLHGQNVLVGTGGSPYLIDLDRLTRKLDGYWETAVSRRPGWDPDSPTSLATYYISHALGAYGFSPSSSHGPTRIDLTKHLELVDPTPTPRFVDTPAVLYDTELGHLSQIERDLADTALTADLLRRIERGRPTNAAPYRQFLSREHVSWYFHALTSRSEPPDWAAVRQVLERVAETLVAHALGLVRRALIPMRVVHAPTLIDRLDHSLDSHRSRAPGRTRNSFLSVVLRGLALG